MDVGRHPAWERNGNFPRQKCGIHAMDEPPPSPVRNEPSAWKADWNSNQIVSSDSNTSCKEEVVANQNRAPKKSKPFVSFNSPPPPPPPPPISGVKQKDLSYDDLSKNIDANLAEIDMETFRSEDINSILALPAIYSGNYESVSHGEQCASVSGSLLNGLEIEASVSNRNSEDEISICKDEPLFSPQKEPPIHERAISVDSLDSSSSYDQDLVLTCKANKNNYTIVFEGSETQFSEDSEYHSGGRSSEGESSRSEAAHMNHGNFYTSSSMIQSDLVLTTWSNLKRIPVGRRRHRLTDASAKSQSLPNLSYQAPFFYDKKLLHLARLHKSKNFQFHDFENFHPSSLQAGRQCCYPYTLSLVKLFMKYKVSSRSSVCSSDQSSSTNSLVSHSLNNVNNFLHSSVPRNEAKVSEFREKKCSDLANRNYTIRNVSYENLNCSGKRQLFMDNVKTHDWHPAQNAKETNNNISKEENTTNTEHPTNNRLSICNNNKEVCISNSPATTATSTPGTGGSSAGECDNSQYFEDSLIEAPVLQTKNFHATPIKEEEETDVSSGDEVMKTSGGSENCDSTADDDDVVVIQNNALDVVTNIVRQENDHNLERINNIFPTSKSNVPTGSSENERMNLNKTAQFQNQGQDTQTKQCNGNFSVNTDVALPSVTSKVPGRRINVADQLLIRCSSSRETSPNSSGYVSSRHSSLERLQRSVTSAVESPSKSVPASRLSNIQLTKNRSCSTQIPVHVKDCSMQTSFREPVTSDSRYLYVKSSKLEEDTEKDSTEEEKEPIPEQAENSESRPKISGISSVMHRSLSKEDKCIYVCFPNYSLPDLSFLNSLLSDGSGSVFLSPSKYRLPNEMIRTVPSVSSEELDSSCRKRLQNIKDWDSLSVLLPDNLKHLIKHIHSESGDSENRREKTYQRTNDCSNKKESTESVKEKDPLQLSDKSSSSNKTPSSILRKCSVSRTQDKNTSPPQSVCCSSAQMRKTCMVPKSSEKTSNQPCKFCSCQHSDESDHPSQANLGDHGPVYDYLKLHNKYSVASVCGSSTKCKALPLKTCAQPQKEQAGACAVDSCAQHLTLKSAHNPKSMLSGFGAEGALSSGCCHARACHYPGRHPFEEFDGSYEDNLCSNTKNGVSLMCQDVGNLHCCHGEMKADKSHPLQFVAPDLKACGTANSPPGHKDTVCNHLYDSDAAPQEFVVSPVQNTSPCSAPHDSYLLPNPLAQDNSLFHSSLRKKTGLVENLQRAAMAIFDEYSKNKCSASCCTSFSVGQKILTSLCPAVHTILSDGLLPSVQGFFGPLPNSPWKVAEASVQLESSRKGVQDLLKEVNSEKLLTDSTYRFNAFIIGLLNLGCLEWWLGHLLSSRSLICHHYHPTALLSLLSLPASAHLQQELKELVSPLTNLTFNLDLAFETQMAAAKGPGKCSNCCSQEKSKVDKNLALDDCNMNKAPHFTFCFSHKEQNSSNVTASGNIESGFLGQKLSSKNENDDPWPGITINPFPNVQTAEEVSKKFFTKASGQKQTVAGKAGCSHLAAASTRDKMPNKKIVPEAMCSSTDSGCSSQAAQSRDISSAATDSGESESHSSGRQDVQQFRRLQQKWEKLALGGDSEKHAKNAPLNASGPNAGNSMKKTGDSLSRRLEKGQLKAAVVKDGSAPSLSKRGAAAASTSTASKTASKMNARDQAEAVGHERKQQQPPISGATSSSPRLSSQRPEKERRSKSQIPTFRSPKSLIPKSKIPIQRSGGRAHSVNRDKIRNS